MPRCPQKLSNDAGRCVCTQPGTIRGAADLRGLQPTGSFFIATTQAKCLWMPLDTIGLILGAGPILNHLVSKFAEIPRITHYSLPKYSWAYSCVGFIFRKRQKKRIGPIWPTRHGRMDFNFNCMRFISRSVCPVCGQGHSVIKGYNRPEAYKWTKWTRPRLPKDPENGGPDLRGGGWIDLKWAYLFR